MLGGAGFIGHHIVRELRGHGYGVRVLVRPTSQRKLLDDQDVDIVEGDLADLSSLVKALQGIDYLIHAAAYYPVYSLNRRLHLSRGLRQIENIHGAISASEVKRFVYVSTLSAVGKYPDGLPEDEKAPYPPARNRGAYPMVKRGMQLAVLAGAERFNSVIVAPTAVFGEGDIKPTTGRMIVEAAKGAIPVAVEGRTNVVDVRDVATGARLALEKGRKGRLYVLGGVNITMPDLIGKIAELLDAKPPRFAMNPRLLLPLACLSEIVGKLLGSPAPLIPLVGLNFAIYGEFVSSAVAEEEIGYRRTASIEPAISRAIEWFRSNGYIR